MGRRRGDGSQRNEFTWFLTALNGGVIDPDSGIDDDPVPGPGNDYNDPFFSDGLPVPWFAALGNHETQYNGGFGILTDEIRAAAAADQVYQSGWFDNDDFWWNDVCVAVTPQKRSTRLSALLVSHPR